ncbi:MAG: hypothetical protein KDC13_07105 [Bacteroidetes bacterium]|nr:hypothetical protein [Bacteroidota bacterium]
MNKILVFILLLLPAFAFGQTPRKINVQSANSLEFDERTDAQRLVGNVVFEHEGTLLYCDSAYLYPDNRMDAYSHVRIVSDSVVATGDELRYDGNSKLGVLQGNVVMTDPDSRLETDLLYYDLANKSASYTTGGVITGERNNLSSIFGQYRSAERMFYFRKDVVLKNEKYTTESDSLHYSTLTEIAYFFGPTTITSEKNKIYCERGFYDTKNDYSEFIKSAKFESRGQIIEADTLRYDRKTGHGKAYRDVIITDTSEKVVIRGNMADYREESGEMLVADRAEMQKQFGKDTLFLHADTLLSLLDTISDKRTLIAHKKAQFYKSDFQGRCDSLVYAEADSMMRLFRNPVIWNDENQLTADTIFIQLANDELDRLFLQRAGFIASQVDSLHFNQIKGRDITGYFEDNELSRVHVRGNGESVYFAEDDDGKYIGINKAVCSDMMIYLDSSSISSIMFYVEPEATLFPTNQLPEDEMKLRGLRWLGEIRPLKREDIFIWKSAAEKADDSRRKRIIQAD